MSKTLKCFKDINLIMKEKPNHSMHLEGRVLKRVKYVSCPQVEVKWKLSPYKFGSRCGCWTLVLFNLAARIAWSQITLLRLIRLYCHTLCTLWAACFVKWWISVQQLTQKGCGVNCLLPGRPFTEGCGRIPAVCWSWASFTQKNVTSVSFQEHVCFTVKQRSLHLP